MAHLDAAGRPLLEDARPRAQHLLVLTRGTPGPTSPALAVDLVVGPAGAVRVVEWRRGQVWRVLRFGEG